MTIQKQHETLSALKPVTKPAVRSRFKRVPKRKPKASKLIYVNLGVCCEQSSCNDDPMDGCAACSSCNAATRPKQQTRVRAKLKAQGLIWLRWKMAPVDEPDQHIAVCIKKEDYHG